ncbi:anaerobic ribonucleoside-triphosphate reductase activating protein [Actinomycetaceae bacterium TAE3-ERU4]|nr:anaerobic ribonucleoside-triphosphate reductase activating protein [Actinomycetaceae bacterium TAE3-ERU4]
MNASADKLKIAGLVPFSTVDWPGKLAATAFLQGCPWRCVYCQNKDILDPRTPGQVTFQEIRDLLSTRGGMLDGIVFSGGEPLMQSPALLNALQEIKERGFARGLHTGGAYPGGLEKLLKAELLDWVGLDIKGRAQDFGSIIGLPAAAGQRAFSKTWNALELLQAAKIDYEVRITIFPQGSDWLKLVEKIISQGAPRIALQQARALGASEEFSSRLKPDWDRQFTNLARAAQKLAKGSGTELEIRGNLLPQEQEAA